ncbi:hypothetical protein KR222_000914 [Zaprionus bogoriensis]|nr:hypothetical protein KR222_000914 [Zaprionus bogoriensis]
MGDTRERDLKDLINSILFLMNRQNFHMHQINLEEKRFRKAIENYVPTHRRVEIVRQIREYQLLMAENTRQIHIHQNMLKKFLELNEDLKDSVLYHKADEVLKQSFASVN